MQPILRLSWFGPPCASFLVPAKAATAAARRGGQGRPLGRRALRAFLDGAEHGRTLDANGTSHPRPRPGFRGAAALGLALSMWLAAPAPSRGAERSVEPASISRIVDEAAARFELPPLWIHAVIAAESGGDARAVSPKGAMGLMQLMPGTWGALSAQHRLGSDPFDRRANVLAGAAYMRQLLDRFGRDGFLAAYNAGPTRYVQTRTGGRPLPAETLAYVARVERSIAAGPSGLAPGRAPRASDWRAAGLFAQTATTATRTRDQSLFPARSEGTEP